ncbi:MAG: transcription antitermination factor NusB [Deferribacteraceae bacterium]|nr:transcription antitermination factor NusB [Deferribacteraceae bacterium]
MKKKRTVAREYAVQMMYQSAITESPPEEMIPVFWQSFENVQGEVASFAEQLFTGAYSRREEHDRVITQFLKASWSFERLGEVEKCILRVGIDELLYSDTPKYAVLDDYVTLARRFTDEKTAAFVNGIMESVYSNFAG